MYAMVPSGDPQAMKRQPIAAIETKRSRKPRDLKTYKNPHNGEVVQTKGGNHAVLKPGRLSMVATKSNRGSSD